MALTLTDLKEFDSVCQEALSKLHNVFLISGPVNVSKVSGDHAASWLIGPKECSHYAYTKAPDSEEKDEFYLLDVRIKSVCTWCLPTANTLRALANILVNTIIVIRNGLETLIKDEDYTYQLNPRLLMHIVPLGASYTYAHEEKFSSLQRAGMTESICMVEKALWDLCQKFQEVDPPSSSEAAYVVHDLYRATMDTLPGDFEELEYGKTFGDEVALAGALVSLPRTTVENLWVVCVPKRLVSSVLFSDGRALNITRLPTLSEMEMVRTFYQDGMGLEDAVETALSL